MPESTSSVRRPEYSKLQSGAVWLRSFTACTHSAWWPGLSAMGVTFSAAGLEGVGVSAGRCGAGWPPGVVIPIASSVVRPYHSHARAGGHTSISS